MNDKSTFENFGMRDKIADLSPQRLDFLTKVFDIVCEIYSIPLDALEEREALAIKIIVESRSISDEGKMLEAARKAAESYRQKSRKPSLSVVPSVVSSHKKQTP